VRRSAVWLIGLLGLTASVAAVGARSTTQAIPTWYRRRLRKPRWTPPEQVFGPVWSVLYVSMSIAAWLVVRAAESEPRQRTATVRLALGAWLIQLGLNLAWSLVFFGRRSVAGGVGVIAALWLAIVATVAAFARVSWVAAALLMPYLAWTTFAAALNVRIWQLASQDPGSD
jgi:tryptophan-rich sensory protein